MNTSLITRSTGSNQVPERVTFHDMVVRGGGTPDEAKAVLCEKGSHQFKAPGVFADKPLESIDEYKANVQAMYEEVEHSEVFSYYGFNDVAVNFTRLLRRTEGGVARSKRVGMKLPQERTVEVGYDARGVMQYETIPGDWMTVPSLPDAKARVITDLNGNPVVHLTYRRFCQEAIIGFLSYLHDLLRTQSIYKGQAITSDFEYVDVSKVDPTKAVFAQETGRLLNKWCLSPISNAKANDAAGISPKANVIIAGEPGNGKTTFLNIIKRHAVDHGWTAIELPAGATPHQFERALGIARVYMDHENDKGVVLVAEDIEKMAVQDRSKTLEVLDGGRGKFDRLVTVLTTNFPRNMDRAMVRAERIHALIEIPFPDEDVYRRLVEMRLDGSLADDIDWAAAFEANEGYTPAWIIGGLESVIRGVIARTGTHKDLVVTTEDLIDAANDYRAQYRIQQESADQVSDRDEFLTRFGEFISEHARARIDYDQIAELVNDHVRDITRKTYVNLETESGKEISGKLDV